MLCGQSGSPITTGILGLKMPAFSRPITSRLSPRKATWSISIEVMTAKFGSTILVASKRPPRPTSRITTSNLACLNSANAESVLNSK